MNIGSILSSRTEKENGPKLINWPAQSPYIYTYVIIRGLTSFYIKGDYSDDIRFRFTSATFLKPISLIRELDVQKGSPQSSIVHVRPCDIIAVGKVRFNQPIDEYSAVKGDEVVCMIDSEGKTDDE